MLITAIAIYLVITFILTLFGVENQEEALKTFFLTILFTPIYGLYVLLKEKRNSSKVDFYYCPHCDYIYPLKLKHCPICEEKGRKVKLIKYENPHNLKVLYKNLSLA